MVKKKWYLYRVRKHPRRKKPVLERELTEVDFPIPFVNIGFVKARNVMEARKKVSKMM